MGFIKKFREFILLTERFEEVNIVRPHEVLSQIDDRSLQTLLSVMVSRYLRNTTNQLGYLDLLLQVPGKLIFI